MTLLYSDFPSNYFQFHKKQTGTQTDETFRILVYIIRLEQCGHMLLTKLNFRGFIL